LTVASRGTGSCWRRTSGVVEVVIGLGDAERFIEEARGDDLELASYLRIEERELGH